MAIIAFDDTDGAALGLPASVLPHRFDRAILVRIGEVKADAGAYEDWLQAFQLPLLDGLHASPRNPRDTHEGVR
jgi:hypothetical protein